MNRKRWIGVMVATAVVTGYFMFRGAYGSDIAIVGHAFEFKVASRGRVLARPWVNLKLPLFGLVVFPKPEPTAARFAGAFRKFTPDAPGVIYSTKTDNIGIDHWEIDRQTGDEGQRASSLPYIALPEVYGSESKVIRYYPGGNALPVKIRVPGNGEPAPEIEDQVVTAGAYKIRFHPRPVVSPAIPITIEVSVENAKPNDQFFLTFPEGGRLLCGLYPGQLRLERYDDRPLDFEFCRVEFSTVKLQRTTAINGDVESLTLRLPSGETWLHGEVNGPNAKAHFEATDSYITGRNLPPNPDWPPERVLAYGKEARPYVGIAGQNWAWALLRAEEISADRWQMIDPVAASVDLKLPALNSYRPATGPLGFRSP